MLGRVERGVSGLHFDADGQLTSISSEERLSRLYGPFVDACLTCAWAGGWGIQGPGAPKRGIGLIRVIQLGRCFLRRWATRPIATNT
jgi:hypothetical protein